MRQHRCGLATLPTEGAGDFLEEVASKSKGLGEAHPQMSVKRVVLRECGKRRGMRLEGERGPDPKGPCLLPEGVWSFMWKLKVEGDFFFCSQPEGTWTRAAAEALRGDGCP